MKREEAAPSFNVGRSTLEIHVLLSCCLSHQHPHNNNTSPSRQIMILFWNHTILPKTKAKRFVRYTRLFTTAGTIVACELQPVLKTDSEPVMFILDLLLKWASSSLQSKQRGCCCAHLRLGHWNMSWLEILQWKKKMKPQWKINPVSPCHMCFVLLPFKTKANLITVRM